ncbi:hypothetical protein N9L68_01720 [bacterium]|nr:hypothetical protein [bacterium]
MPPGQGGPTWQQGPGGWSPQQSPIGPPPGFAAGPTPPYNSARFTGLPKDMERAAGEIYASMMRCGTSARDWLMLSGTPRGTAAWQCLWMLVTQLDIWTDRERATTPRGWSSEEWIQAQLNHSVEMETLLRQLAATVHVRRTGDNEAGDRIRALAMPGEEIAPSWLLDDSRSYSQQIHKQKAWLRAGSRVSSGGGGAPKGDKKGKGDGKGKQKGGKAKPSPDTQG